MTEHAEHKEHKVETPADKVRKQVEDAAAEHLKFVNEDKEAKQKEAAKEAEDRAKEEEKDKKEAEKVNK